MAKKLSLKPRRLVKELMFCLSLFINYNFENASSNSEKDMVRKECLTYKQNFKHSVFSYFYSGCIFHDTNSYG